MTSDVEKTTQSPSPRNSEQNGDEDDIDLCIKDISVGGEKGTATMESSPLKDLRSRISQDFILKTSSWSPFVAISAVFLISMAAFVIVTCLLIRRLDIASKKVNILPKCYMDP